MYLGTAVPHILLIQQGISFFVPVHSDISYQQYQALWPPNEIKIKREVRGACPAFEPFRCPREQTCISIQYLCDGAPDCSDAYDEDPRLCTAARRPPVEETSNFLKSLLHSHGPDFLQQLFGPRGKNNLQGLGGVERVAIVLSESQTIQDLGDALDLGPQQLKRLEDLFLSVYQGRIEQLLNIGIKEGEIGDMKYFFEKLINTGFLDVTMKHIVG